MSRTVQLVQVETGYDWTRLHIDVGAEQLYFVMQFATFLTSCNLKTSGKHRLKHLESITEQSEDHPPPASNAAQRRRLYFTSAGPCAWKRTLLYSNSFLYIFILKIVVSTIINYTCSNLK